MKPVIAEIFSQGEEVVSGQTLDSNAAWLSQCLVDMGFAVKRHTAVGDELEDLIQLLKEIAQRADCCICTGGLGPTIDDLTREAVSRASGLPLLIHAASLQRIEAYFASRNRDMPAVNRNQAYLPEGALPIDNPLGSAPGFALKIQACWFVFLPGVPSEMKSMFPVVERWLKEQFTLQADALVTLRSVGIGESAIQQRLAELELPDGVRLGFRAASDEVQTKLRFAAGFDRHRRQVLTEQLASVLGEHVFAIDSPEQQQGDLTTVIGQRMRQLGWRLSVVETASQGLIAAKCLGHDWLRFVQFSADIAITAGKWGCAYHADEPAQSAAALAEHLLQQQAIDCQLVQLYRGSLTGREAIMIYNALQTPLGFYCSSMSVAGSMHNKQNQAAVLALDLLRRSLPKP